jgi:transcription-repair coupling factor (superfamily II helicase)
MVLEGKLKSPRRNAYLPYRLDVGLDVIYVRLRHGNAAYSDYVELEDQGIFRDHYAIVDYDQNKRPIGFTVEGLIEDYRHASLKNRLMVDLGGIVVQHASSRVKEAVKDRYRDLVQDYLKRHVRSIEPRTRLFGAPAYAY